MSIVAINGEYPKEVELRCFKVIDYYWNRSIKKIENLSTCIAGNANILHPNTTISRVLDITGDEIEDTKSIEGLFFVNSDVNFVPQNISKFFPNLKALWLSNVNLKSLVKENLANLPDLKYLYIAMNDLKTLRKDVFENNPKLYYISMHNNDIEYIENGIIDGLESLYAVLYRKCSTKKSTFYFSNGLTRFDASHFCSDSSALTRNQERIDGMIKLPENLKKLYK